ncbi:hypothetical protein V565_055810 [Rhizoctonia solani 123E]|uniref:BTB/POZ domain protein n=1 Tax=Rhizoctonia solani 123E TaxID=1423351 RepID=A0A074RXW6_9AGAM|nr:hypothetical protein V565_055810 [Rhizoctonia solani 123E]
MSKLKNSGNNKFPPLGPSIPQSTASSPTKSAVRDLRFYYHDGSAVFLAGNKLFKFQASLLAADADVQDYEFKPMMQNTIDDFWAEMDRPGTSDARPIVLPPDVTSNCFRRFLISVFGGVGHPALANLLENLQTPSSRDPAVLSHLMGVGYLASRFGMTRIDAWSQRHIHTILTSWLPPYPENWDTEFVLQLAQYMQSTTVTGYSYDILVRMRLILACLVTDAYDRDKDAPRGRIIDMCAALYNRKDLLINGPGLFGFLFAVVVSLGHRSSIWTNDLTREDRRVLYAASTILTCLRDQADLGIHWFSNRSVLNSTCSQCSHFVNLWWHDVFSECGDFQSRVLLEDIRRVVALPSYHLRFRELADRKSFSCQCLNKINADIEQHIEDVYCNLTEKYTFLVQTV